MSIRQSLRYPHDEASEFTGFNFQYGSAFGTSISIFDVSGSDSVYYNNRSGTLPQKFFRSYIYAPPVYPNRHRGYAQFNYYTPANSATFAPAPIPRLVASFDVFVSTELNVSASEWFSLATFTSDYGSNWIDVVTVNIDNYGTMNTSFKTFDIISGSSIIDSVYYEYGQIFTSTSAVYPKDRWNRLEMYIDYGVSQNSACTMITYLNSIPVYWEDSTYSISYVSSGTSLDVTSTQISAFSPAKQALLSATNVPGYIISSVMIPTSAVGTSQMHFGLYSHPDVTSAVCLNDNLMIVVPN